MGKLLEVYFSPGMTVDQPPADLLGEYWFPPMLRRIEAFIGGIVQAFEGCGLNDWYRAFQRQSEMFAARRTSAAVSEHCFAAALDVNIPDEFRGQYAIDFFAKVAKLDRHVRIGWLDYQKPSKQAFTFFHAGFGFMVPFDVRRKFIDSHFSGKQAEETWFKVNQSWKPGMRW